MGKSGAQAGQKRVGAFGLGDIEQRHEQPHLTGPC
jgi:hypothetical protein